MTRNRRSRGRVVVASVLIGALVVAACGDDDAEEGAAGDSASATTGSTGTSGSAESTEPAEPTEPVTLTVWSWRPEDEDAYTKIFDVYEQQHPGVTVEFVPYVNTDYNNILATGLTGEGGPDVAQLRAFGGIQPLIEAGQLVPLDDQVSTLAGFSDEILQGAQGREDGQTYGVPFAVQTAAAFYNVAIFEELGLEEPTTWDEFIAVLDALDDAGRVPIATPAKDVWMLPIVHDTVAAARYGGPTFEADVLAGETDFTNPDYVASIEAVGQLAPYFPDDVVGVSYTDAKTLFATGTAGIFIGGSFEVGFWGNEAPDLELGVFRVPAPPGSAGEALTPGWMDGSYGVNANSDATEQAVELVDWMGTPEFGQLFTDELKQLSPVPGVTPTDPLLAEFGELYAEAPTPYLLLVDFRYGTPLGTDLMANGLQQLLLDQVAPEDVAGSIQEGIAQWFQPG